MRDYKEKSPLKSGRKERLKRHVGQIMKVRTKVDEIDGRRRERRRL